MANPNIGLLIYKFKRNKISSKERGVLDAWVAESEKNKLFFEQALDSDELLQQYSERRRIIGLSDKKDVWHRMLAAGVVSKPKLYWLSGWRKYSVAATLLVGLTVVCYVLLNQPEKKTDVVKAPVVSSIVPGQAKAILTLSDGRKVALDSAIASTITEGNVTVQNKNGQLSYTSTSGSHKENVYNTLSTTVGQIYSTVLSDGSKIYLNSLSSIRYPVVFGANERNVEITGEAYFEVTHDRSRPFKVLMNGLQIEVTGTSFNIQAYGDEAAIKTTLLRGGVKVTSYAPTAANQQTTFLKPGQQAQFKRDGALTVSDKANIEEVLGWKNNMFVFHDTRIDVLMRQLKRWYNVDAQYGTDVTDLAFTGQMSKYINITDALEILELSGEAHYTLQNGKILITRIR